MDFIKDWAILVAVLIIVAGIVEGLMPQVELKKYVNLVMGFLLISVLLRPIVNIKAEELIRNDFEFEINEGVVSESRREQLENAAKVNIEKDIASRLKKFGELQARVEINVDDNNVLTVSSITLIGAPEKSRKEIANELIKNYECNEIGFD